MSPEKQQQQTPASREPKSNDKGPGPGTVNKEAVEKARAEKRKKIDSGETIRK
jgi:hypothetical protein